MNAIDMKNRRMKRRRITTVRVWHKKEFSEDLLGLITKFLTFNLCLL